MEDITAQLDHIEAAYKKAEEGSIKLQTKGLAEWVAPMEHNRSLQKGRTPSPTHSTNIHNTQDRSSLSTEQKPGAESYASPKPHASAAPQTQ